MKKIWVSENFCFAGRLFYFKLLLCIVVFRSTSLFFSCIWIEQSEYEACKLCSKSEQAVLYRVASETSLSYLRKSNISKIQSNKIREMAFNDYVSFTKRTKIFVSFPSFPPKIPFNVFVTRLKINEPNSLTSPGGWRGGGGGRGEAQLQKTGFVGL